MKKEAFIFEVSANNFEQSVIKNSHKLPVLVEFLGVWSSHCMLMENMFAELAREFPEQFIFAKVDIDEQDSLKNLYKIQNVPTLMVFSNGNIVLREEGVMSEYEARNILRKYGIYHKSDLIREQAREKHMAGDTSAAIFLLTEAIKNDPTNTRVAMDMVQIFIDIHKFDNAEELFSKLPIEDQENNIGRSLSWQLTFAKQAAKTSGYDACSQQVIKIPDNYEARFDLAICQIARHQHVEAMDNLFYIQQHQPEFKETAAKELIITMINMLKQSDPELSARYQQQLSNLLSG